MKINDLKMRFTHLREKFRHKFTSLQKILLLLVSLVVCISLILLFKHFISSNKKSPAKQLPLVNITQARHQDVPVYLTGLGTVTPLQTVTIRTQVNGILEKIYVKEGQAVKAGDLLAQIDSRPFLAQLTQFEGQLAKDMALLKNAKIDLERYQNLWKEDSISKQIVDTQISLVNQLEGTLKTDQGLVNNAKINLAYTKIKAPINGHVGLRSVDPGNFVQTSDQNGLFIINNIQPIYVVFSVAEDNVPKIIIPKKSLPTEIFDRSQTKLLGLGKISSIDNQIDPTTGTIKLKALFKNQQYELFPNQFVNVRLMIDKLSQAIVIPTTAIQRGSEGTFVYIYEHDTQKVKIQSVELGVNYENDTVILSGINLNDFVVIEGTDKLTEGAQVNVSKNRNAHKVASLNLT